MANKPTGSHPPGREMLGFDSYRNRPCDRDDPVCRYGGLAAARPL